MDSRCQRFIHIILISAFLSIVLSSCYVEKKLGKEFRENWKDTTVMVLVPEYVFKNNLKTYEIPGLDTFPEWKQDSMLLARSIFLKDISDSVVITDFTARFMGRLEKLGFNVMDEARMDEFLSEHPDGIIVNLAQMSVEEFVHPYTFDYDLGDEMLTVSDIDLNAVSFNLWMEISKLNSSEKNRVLFASDFVVDELDGYFRQYVFTGDINFEYTIDTLTTSRIYTFASGLGARYAEYLYDHFLNLYIVENVPDRYLYDIRPLHWNPDIRMFEFKEDENRFLELDVNR